MIYIGLIFLAIASVAIANYKGAEIMSQALRELTEEVRQSREVKESAIVLIESLATRLREALGDEEALRQLSLELDSSANRLAEAVASNTEQSEDDIVVEDAPEDEPR